MIDTLIAQASSILENAARGNEEDGGGVDDEILLTQINEYLDTFDLWRAKQGETIGVDLTEDARERLRQKLRSLQDLHLNVMALTENRKGLLTNRLSDVSRRAKALRSYVDHYPSRINITGRRKG